MARLEQSLIKNIQHQTLWWEAKRLLENVEFQMG